MQEHYTSSRLQLGPLSNNDGNFILDLLNSQGWLAFIGDRNIRNIEEAGQYIQKITYNPDVTYWVVRLKGQNTPIGIITFIKRDYLDHHDIGFAFLPEYSKQGFAYEAAKTVLNDLLLDDEHSIILATTVPENKSSIRLLEKLGFRMEKEIEADKKLLLYVISTDKFQIDQIVAAFFAVFNNTGNRQPDWSVVYKLCIPQTMIIKKNGVEEIIYNLDNFIEPRKKLLSDGVLINFEEYETKEETNIKGSIAQRFSEYRKKGDLNGEHFDESGNKMFQFIRNKEGWRISSVIWEDDYLS